MFSRSVVFFFQAEDGIRDLVRSRGLGDVYKRQLYNTAAKARFDYQHSVSTTDWLAAVSTFTVALQDVLAELAAVSYKHLTLPTSDLV